MALTEIVDLYVGDDERRINFDFSEFPEMVAGQVISTVDALTDDRGELTLSSPAIQPTLVQVPLSQGSAQPGTGHLVSCQVTTDGGIQLVQFGRVAVKSLAVAPA